MVSFRHRPQAPIDRLLDDGHRFFQILWNRGRPKQNHWDRKTRPLDMRDSQSGLFRLIRSMR